MPRYRKLSDAFTNVMRRIAPPRRATPTPETSLNARQFTDEPGESLIVAENGDLSSPAGGNSNQLAANPLKPAVGTDFTVSI
jgi:hypothetical protein